jgi:alanine racemase
MPCHCGSGGAGVAKRPNRYARPLDSPIRNRLPKRAVLPIPAPMTLPHPSQRLTIDLAALARNYRALARASGQAECGAAVKANGYGLGIDRVVRALSNAGCQSFFVASLAEALAVRAANARAEIILLHGVGAREIPAARAADILPVINTPAQAKDWASTSAPCAAMIDTGINRLGLGPDQLDALEGLEISLLMSHLACADTPGHPLNRQQLAQFRDLSAHVPARRRSLANSCGIALGPDYHFDLTRPGIGLYGGLEGFETVICAQAQVLSRRIIAAGQSVGYGGTWVAARDTPVVTLGLGYADGYLRSFSGCGIAYWQDVPLPVIGRVSMDLITLDARAAPDLVAGDWVELLGPQMPLPRASTISGLSEYELLTSLGSRYQRLYRE